MQRPNIVILMADELRGDCVNAPNVKTPNIDSIAGGGGVIFKNNFTANPVCGPARCSVFTGQYVHDGGHRSLYQLLRPHEENLFKFLKNGGYNIIWIGRNDLFSKSAIKGSVTKRVGLIPAIIRKFLPRLSFSVLLKILKEAIKVYILRKYSIYESRLFEYIGPYMKLNPYPRDHKMWNSFHYGSRTPLQASLDMDGIFTERALKFINALKNKRQKKPFCLYVAFNFPHPPYEVEEPYYSMYNRETVETLPCVLKDKPSLMTLMHQRNGLDRLDGADFKEIRATYLGMITRLDDRVGQILNALKEAGVYDQTAVFFTSDHGDYAGDYGLVEKWPNAMQDCLLNVPLLVKIPGAPASQTIHDALTQTLDIFPTILDIAEIHPRYTHFGRSLLPLLKGASDHRDAVFAEGGYDPRDEQCFEESIGTRENPLSGVYHEKIQIPKEFPSTVCRTTMVRTRDWKLVLRSNADQKNELYDLTDDPHELNNLFGQPQVQQVVAELKDRLLQWYLETSDNPHWERERNV